jgi:predicted nucleotidyltransferase
MEGKTMNIKNKDIRNAIGEFKQILIGQFGHGIELYIFGSVARDEYGVDSDIDILVLLPGIVDTDLKERIIDLAFDIELKYNVVIQIIARSKEYWKSERASFTSFHQNVQRDGILV